MRSGLLVAAVVVLLAKPAPAAERSEDTRIGLDAGFLISNEVEFVPVVALTVARPVKGFKLGLRLTSLGNDFAPPPLSLSLFAETGWYSGPFALVADAGVGLGGLSASNADYDMQTFISPMVLAGFAARFTLGPVFLELGAQGLVMSAIRVSYASELFRETEESASRVFVGPRVALGASF